MQGGERRPRWAGVVCAFLVVLTTLGAPGRPLADDGHVEQGGDRFRPNPKVLSQPILQHPIYGCADTAVVMGFEPHAELQIFVAGDPTPIGIQPNSIDLGSGQVVKVSIHFTPGQVISAKQVMGGVTSPPSNTVTVTDYKTDYPSGLPQPQIDPAICLDCGAAVGVTDVIPGSSWTVSAQDPIGGGAFGPKMSVGNGVGHSYAFVSPRFKAGQQITVQSTMCTDTSQPSPPQIVQPDPATIPPPTIDPFFQGADEVVVRGPGGTNLLDGATLAVFGSFGPAPSQQIGGQPTPGGAQAVLINPMAPGGGPQIWATQALCTPSTTGPRQTGQPCSSLPAAKVRPPVVPGDTMLSLISFVPGSEITVFALNGGVTTQIGAGGGSEITLTQPVKNGDTIFVVQSLGDCQASLVFVVQAGCSDIDPNVCSGDWPAYRHSGWRDGQQTIPSVLADPDQVRSLKPMWIFTPPAADNPVFFKASPIVFQGTVFIGNGNGRLYALDAVTGKMLWEFPKPPAPALTSQYNPPPFTTENPSSAGIASSASIAFIENQRPVAVFAAPDQSIGAGLGSGRLFALDPATGNPVWKSPEIAVLNGLTQGSFQQRHEQIGYSSPLVLDNRIYVGIADHGDDPIQAGRVVAVDVNSGAIVSGFGFSSTGTRGGGIWSSAAGGLDKGVIAITTGNSRIDPMPEPSPDNALSMLGLDATSGAINWKLRAVPFALDGDPDWAAGPALLDASCGHAAASTEKDGWTYAARSNSTGGGSPSVLWQFPPTGIPFTSGNHGDTRYIKAGAGWNDTYVTMDGGYEVQAGQAGFGFSRLHALDVCAPSSQPVLWIADIPETMACPGAVTEGFNTCEYQMGPPTVTGGIVFVGTGNGHLIALADPAVYPSALSVCSNPEVAANQCTAMGFALVPRPIQLLDLALGSGFGSIQTEPVLAGGRVFVAGDGGQVMMLAPGK